MCDEQEILEEIHNHLHYRSFKVTYTFTYILIVGNIFGKDLSSILISLDEREILSKLVVDNQNINGMMSNFERPVMYTSLTKNFGKSLKKFV